MEQRIYTLWQAAAQADKAALDQLSQLRADVEYLPTVAGMFVSEGLDINCRIGMGIELKVNYKLPGFARVEVQQAVVQALQNKELRSVACGIICKGVGQKVWDAAAVSRLLHSYIERVAQGISEEVLGGVRAYRELCDEAIHALDDQSLTAETIPVLLTALQHAQTRKDAFASFVYIVEYARESPNGFVLRGLQAAVMQLMSFCLTTIDAMQVENQELSNAIRCVYQSLRLFWNVPEVANNFDHALNIINKCLSHQASSVKLEVVEFWQAVLMVPQYLEKCVNFFPQLAQWLVVSMQYDDIELGELQFKVDDCNEPDKASDVRPKSYTRRKATEDVDDEEEVETWNLRRAAAQCLDALAQSRGEAIFTPAMKNITQMFQSQDWREREAAIFAIGAISDGCMPQLEGYLGNLLPAFHGILVDDSQPLLIKCTTAWTVGGNIAEWLVENNIDVLKQIALACAQMLFSPTKYVQTHGINALVALFNQAVYGELNEITPQITERIAQGIKHYQLKNKYLVLELIDNLCASSSGLEENLVGTLLPPLLDIAQGTQNTDLIIFPLFMALSGLAAAAGDALPGNVVDNLFQRALTLAMEHSQSRIQAIRTQQPPPDDSEGFCAAAVDLIAGLVASQGNSFAPYIQRYESQFVELIRTTAQDPDASVCGAAFGLLVELAAECVTFVQKHFTSDFGQLLQSKLVLIDALVNTPADPAPRDAIYTYRVSISNAAVCLGFFAERAIETCGPVLGLDHINYFMHIFVRCLSLVANNVLNVSDYKSMLQNICVCIGKFFGAHPEIVQHHGGSMMQWMESWAGIMALVENSHPGKEPALVGVLSIVQQYQQNIPPGPNMGSVFLSMNNSNSDQLKMIIAGILGAGASSCRVWSQGEKQKLLQLYNIAV